MNAFRKITSIELRHWRAYYGEITPISLSKGENLLIYGENGSGKSSLFKAIQSYFASSRNSAVKFEFNLHAGEESGFVRLKFGEFVEHSQLLPGPQRHYSFDSVKSDHSVDFIKLSGLLGGFLDYRDLLRVYLHNETRPNLFDLVVSTLLKQHIPFHSGGTFRFGPKWDQLQYRLTKGCFNRNDYNHQVALSELPDYETHLRDTLDRVFQILNRLLNEFFIDFNLVLHYDLSPLAFNYRPKKSDWHTTNRLHLRVLHGGEEIGDYNDFLNEARLSAIAICLYLASLKLNPAAASDVRVLFLDDVFIGLDAGNRIPILNIIQKEFSDYQVFISTYDRHWYELAKRHFTINNRHPWKFMELYGGRTSHENTAILRPILVEGSTNFDKAVRYLHHRSQPDYPAAANYFRKALEQMILSYMPKYELSGKDFSQVPGFKLTALLSKVEIFFKKIQEDPEHLKQILGLLTVLIHPLSHYEITSPVYRGELLLLEERITLFQKQLVELNVNSAFQCILESGTRLKYSFDLDNESSLFCYYEIVIQENLVIERKTDLTLRILECHCIATKCYGIKDGKNLKPFSPAKKDERFHYQSLEIAYQKIYEELSKSFAVTKPKVENYLQVIEYDSVGLKPLIGKVVWK